MIFCKEITIILK